MKKNKIKLAAFDMDGTLLDEKSHITKNTENALKCLIKNGIRVAFVTGRVYVSPLAYARRHNLKVSIAATNGSFVCNEEKDILYEATLDKSTVKKVLNLLKDKDYYFHLYPIDGLITSEQNSKNPLSKIEGRMPRGNEDEMRRVILPFDDLYNVPDKIYKIIIIFKEPEDRLKFRKLLDIDGVFNSSSWFNNIEVTSPEGTKKHGIEALMNHYGFDWNEVAAFGDNENDLPMLNSAGKAFLMGNADENIKRMTNAKVIGKNYEEGVYKTLVEEFQLEC